MPGQQGAVEGVRDALVAIGCEELPRAWIKRLAIEKHASEKLIWVARPNGSYGKSEVGLWVASAGLVLYMLMTLAGEWPEWEVAALGAWTLPVICLALFGTLMFGSWLSPKRERARVLYALTNQRAILMRFGLFFRIRSFPIREIRRFTRFELDDGSGDLVFERFPMKDDDGNVKTGENGFYGIEDVRQVEKLLQTVIDTQEKTT
ncbi:MAG TPA: hypothetical protein VFV17_04605 [Usitatibacteraceae bacterium]|nr:hypothetical protein [Usitatibacteraceae bacterium]